jgi:periplasmic protein TonB
MFADSLGDSAAIHSHRGWTTLASFAVQALAIGGLLILPFLYTQGVPQLLWRRDPLVPPPAPPPLALSGPATSTSPVNTTGHVLAPPTHFSNSIENPNQADMVPPAPDLPLGYGIRGSTGDHGTGTGVLDSIGNGFNVIAPPPPPTSHPPRVSRMMEGNLIQRVQPVYPILARQARIQGTVVLRAVISREGTIEKLQVASGHPLLVQAAIDAVRQWRYRPYLLNNEPVEVDTQVTVNFVLSGGS